MPKSTWTPRIAARSTAAATVVLLALSAACGDDSGGEGAPATTGPTATTAVPNPATTAPSPTSTTAPPTTTMPAPTAAPDDLAARAFGVEDATGVIAERLEFLGSTLGSSASGGVIRGERAVYFLEAQAGFLLSARIDSLEDNAVFDLYGPDGAMLVTGATTGHALLTVAGDHQIVVGGTRGNATYDLAVALSPAEIVRFEAGAVGTTISGAALSGTRQAYILGAAAGQTMSLSVTSLEDNASLVVRAPSGEVLEAGVTSAEIELPESGDYVVQVGGSPGGTTFELEITIVG